MTNSLSTKIDLKVSLTLQMNQHLIKIEGAGQNVKLIFNSFKSLVNFIYCYHKLKKNHCFLFKNYLKNLDLSYYLGSKLIGESNSKLPFNWLGNYFGMEKSKFYLSQFLSYFLSTKNNLNEI